MKKFKLSRLGKIIGLVIASLVAIPALFVVLYFVGKVFQVSQAEADKVCQEFFEQVKSDIVSVPGYTIIKERKYCSPSQDEAGYTDYYFTVIFRVAKAGNDSVDGMKANINYLVDKFPGKNYPLFVNNAPSTNGQSQTICVQATKQIQENGEVYHSSPPEHYPRYLEPSEFGSGNDIYEFGVYASCADL